jgi:hypothetical protein
VPLPRPPGPWTRPGPAAPALNAFAITVGDRFPAAETHYPDAGNTKTRYAVGYGAKPKIFLHGVLPDRTFDTLHTPGHQRPIHLTTDPPQPSRRPHTPQTTRCRHRDGKTTQQRFTGIASPIRLPVATAPKCVSGRLPT